ncbi:hypothetical protein Ae201684_017330 [Aphanomyces euteiches]|uniref:Uncharacterized protein n=1 Tax=Aphanomyces euteiches TaxID=100861 RepID=A0A6G0W946_9STRA|nr:hypothetical protein Ae201684_017330 [Aphanomyces euteiches]
MDPREIVRRFQNDMHEENHNIAELSQAFHTNPDQIDDAPDTLAPIIDCHFDQSGNRLSPCWCQHGKPDVEEIQCLIEERTIHDDGCVQSLE